MALKCIIDNPVEVPGPLRDYYKKTSDGNFALMLEGEPAGYVKSEKLAEFRNNNRALHATNSELEERLKVFDAIDPTEYLSMKEKLATFVDPAMLTEKHAAEVAAAVDAAKAELTAQHAANQTKLAAELAAEKAAHTETQFKNLVSGEFLRAGGRASAVDYVVSCAAKVFSMKDGELTTKEFSAASPGQTLTLAEWMQAQASVSDFAFLPSRGGGAPPRPAYDGGATRRTVSSDPLEFGRNLAAIAAGEVSVE